MKDVFVALSEYPQLITVCQIMGFFFWDHLMQNINNALSLSLYDFFNCIKKQCVIHV